MIQMFVHNYMHWICAGQSTYARNITFSHILYENISFYGDNEEN